MVRLRAYFILLVAISVVAVLGWIVYMQHFAMLSYDGYVHRRKLAMSLKSRTTWSNRDNPESIRIAYYTPRFGSWHHLDGDHRTYRLAYQSDEGDSKHYNCSISCTLENALIGDIDALLFHHVDVNEFATFPARFSDGWPLWILTTAEPAVRHFYARGDALFSRVFNGTMSYSQRSSAPIDYFYESGFAQGIFDGAKRLVPIDERIDGRALWVASNCNSASGRERYVAELMQSYDVDSYGACMRNANFDEAVLAPESDATGDSQLMRLIARYKFYLAFENANCDDYVTEKFWRLLKLGVVPIVLPDSAVARNRSLYAMNERSVLFADDFESPAALAERMRAIDNDDAEFERLIDYKRRGRDAVTSSAFAEHWLSLRPNDHLAELCEFVHRAKRTRTRVIGQADRTCRSGSESKANDIELLESEADRNYMRYATNPPRFYDRALFEGSEHVLDIPVFSD
jgi:Glycosyltransferase family 10 (fucosyltransferase) C-term